MEITDVQGGSGLCISSTRILAFGNRFRARSTGSSLGRRFFVIISILRISFLVHEFLGTGDEMFLETGTENESTVTKPQTVEVG